MVLGGILEDPRAHPTRDRPALPEIRDAAFMINSVIAGGCFMSEPGYPIQHFSHSNPRGLGQSDIPALLRRVADKLEEYGDIWVQDIVFSNPITPDGDNMKITVYYHLREEDE
jgi:hypothetical protein